MNAVEIDLSFESGTTRRNKIKKVRISRKLRFSTTKTNSPKSSRLRSNQHTGNKLQRKKNIKASFNNLNDRKLFVKIDIVRSPKDAAVTDYNTNNYIHQIRSSNLFLKR